MLRWNIYSCITMLLKDGHQTNNMVASCNQLLIGFCMRLLTFLIAPPCIPRPLRPSGRRTVVFVYTYILLFLSPNTVFSDFFCLEICGSFLFGDMWFGFCFRNCFYLDMWLQFPMICCRDSFTTLRVLSSSSVIFLLALAWFQSAIKQHSTCS